MNKSITSLKIIYLACVASISQASPGEANQTFVSDLTSLLQLAMPYSDDVETTKNFYLNGNNPLLPPSSSNKGGVIWEGSEAKCVTDCSGLALALINQYNSRFDESFFGSWMLDPRPKATQFHDEIFMSNGFEQITDVSMAEAGDFLVMKYGANNDIDNGDSGHVMIMATKPTQRTASDPFLPEGSTSNNGYTQWEVDVFDESTSGHGTEDTRFIEGTEFNKGLGRGTLRIYTDSSNTIKALSWSLKDSSTVYEQGQPNNTADFHIVIGRFNPAFNPSSSRYKLTVNGVGGGTANGYPGTFYQGGATAHLYANADSGKTFLGWTDGITGTANPGRLVMNEDKTVEALFGPAAWANWDEYVNGWHRYDWLGFVYHPGGSWSYHQGLGWLLTNSEDEGNIVAYQNSLGWIYTSSTAFPNLYQVSTNDWLTYQSTSGNTVTLLNQTTGETLNVNKD